PHYHSFSNPAFRKLIILRYLRNNLPLDISITTEIGFISPQKSYPRLGKWWTLEREKLFPLTFVFHERSALMLKIFGGMIIGSLMTMMLLGGVSAADQVFSNVQALYFDQIPRPDTTTTLLLLVILSIFLASLTLWPTKPVLDTKRITKQLRRHC
ncbi:MAG TPA: hypothetical protein DD706_23225, partial [Nitrospiraceae bacterium]|nr:hypothetical protein [Nitrospiraceae bacterium]